MEIETIEEAAEKYENENYNKYDNKYCKDAFIEGAKWQQERSYSEEEVLHLLDTLWDSLDIWYNEINSDKEFNLKDWFKNCELNKKKDNEQTI